MLNILHSSLNFPLQPHGGTSSRTCCQWCAVFILGHTVSQYAISISQSNTGYWLWVIDEVWGQDGWILAELKKERSQYSAVLTEQTWSIKDLLYGFRRNFSFGIQRAVPSGQDGCSILPAGVANHIVRFDSSCPLAELAIYYVLVEFSILMYKNLHL